MTRGHNPSLPNSYTRWRAQQLGVDVRLMDAVDAMGPRLSVRAWVALAAKARRPLEAVMQAELMPGWGLGLSDRTAASTPMPTKKDPYKGANEEDPRTPRGPVQHEEVQL